MIHNQSVNNIINRIHQWEPRITHKNELSTLDPVKNVYLGTESIFYVVLKLLNLFTQDFKTLASLTPCKSQVKNGSRKNALFESAKYIIQNGVFFYDGKFIFVQMFSTD